MSSSRAQGIQRSSQLVLICTQRTRSRATIPSSRSSCRRKCAIQITVRQLDLGEVLASGNYFTVVRGAAACARRDSSSSDVRRDACTAASSLTRSLIALTVLSETSALDDWAIRRVGFLKRRRRGQGRGTLGPKHGPQREREPTKLSVRFGLRRSTSTRRSSLTQSVKVFTVFDRDLGPR
jgi:hypothetical protein